MSTARVPQALSEEPDGHKQARSILGPDFHGLDAAAKHFGPDTADQLDERRELRLYDEKAQRFLSEADTLQVLERSEGELALAATHSLSLPGVYRRQQNRFFNYPDDPWFGRPEQQPWSDQPIAVPWLLFRKDVVPDSESKSITAQREHLANRYPHERLLLPAEFCYCAVLRLLETGQKLCGDYVVRCFVQTVSGHWVSASWRSDRRRGNRLDVCYWGDGASDGIGSCSAWSS
jgi:hypothetical protein